MISLNKINNISINNKIKIVHNLINMIIDQQISNLLEEVKIREINKGIRKIHSMIMTSRNIDNIGIINHIMITKEVILKKIEDKIMKETLIEVVINRDKTGIIINKIGIERISRAIRVHLDGVVHNKMIKLRRKCFHQIRITIRKCLNIYLQLKKVL